MIDHEKLPPIREALGYGPASPWSSSRGTTPSKDDGYIYLDYSELVEAIGVKVVVQRDDDDYQGNSYMLVRSSDGEWGYLTFGWGSCSGCDALQACDSWSDREELRADLARSIHWEPSPAAMHRWLEARPWEDLFEWSWRDTLKQFLAEAAEVLSRAALAAP